jgi:hypothetical protein
MGGFAFDAYKSHVKVPYRVERVVASIFGSHGTDASRKAAENAKKSKER